MATQENTVVVLKDVKNAELATHTQIAKIPSVALTAVVPTQLPTVDVPDTDRKLKSNLS